MSEPGRATVLLEEAGGLEASFLPAAGMLCCSLRHRGAELLAQNRGVEAYARTGKTMGIPLLYPWANRLAGFDYTAAGRGVRLPRDPALLATDANGLPIHGVIGGRLRWHADAASGSSLRAALSWDESLGEPFAAFPFRHELGYTASLGPGRLHVEVGVHASRGEEVPVAFGFHPYLAPPEGGRDGWLVELPAMRRLSLDRRGIPVVGAGREASARSFALAEEVFDDGFDGLADGARFSVSDGSRRIAVEFLGGYPCAQVYAPADGRFICFEPMSAPANALRSGEGLALLAPGELYSASFAVSVEELA